MIPSKMHSILAALLLMQSAFATSFFIRPFSEFTKTTPNIIRGRIGNIHVENGVTPDGGKVIYTFASLDIKDVIKGNITGTQIQIRKLGGTKDGVTLEIPSSVEFTDREEGVYFLSEEQEDHTYEVSSLELGKFTLEQKNGEEILKGGLFAYSRSKVDDHDVVSGDIAENKKPWSITQLKELVKNQGQSSPPPATNSTPTSEQAKADDITRDSLENRLSSAFSTPAPAKEHGSLSKDKENSPLYFGSGVWYTLAIVILTLGIILLFRKK